MEIVSQASRDTGIRGRKPSAATTGHGGVAVADLRRLPALLTAHQAFVVLGVSSSTGYEWIQRGIIPVERIAGRIWVRLVDLAEEVLGVPPAALLGDQVGGPG